MTLAIRIEQHLQARQRRQAERDAARTARDAFVQAQFPLLNARLLEIVRDAVGTHSRLNVTAVAQTLNVIGRSFATLPQTVVTVAATVDAQPLSLRFEPLLEFRGADQFGRVECTADFEPRLRSSRVADIARALLTAGVEMRGTSSGHLVFAPLGRPLELTADHIESALAELLLR